jgi:uncharacterized protein YecT (DUF1311 family)
MFWVNRLMGIFMFARALGLVAALVCAANEHASADHASWNADSPSFSWKAANLSGVEARICDESSGLWNADRAMAALYKEAFDNLPYEHRKALALQQQDWLKGRDRCIELDCIASTYLARSRHIWELILANKNGKPVPVFGKTPQDRIAYLRFLMDYYERDIDSRNKYSFPGLRDSDPDVRAFVAYSLRGPSYTGLLIDLLVTEPDVDVRMSIALSIGCDLTCNGTEPCAEASTVEQHLDNLLIAYKRAATEPAGYGEEQGELQRIFNDYAGEKDWNKCLSPEARKRIREHTS